jgi:hypothetical protein
VSANPESNGKDKARGWIPGPPCGRPGMTLEIDHVHGFGPVRSKSSRSRAFHILTTVLPFVIAGLDPAIYLFRKMDARIKSAHDEY